MPGVVIVPVRKAQARGCSCLVIWSCDGRVVGGWGPVLGPEVWSSTQERWTLTKSCSWCLVSFSR